MRVLFLDTASASPCLVLCDDERTLTFKALPKQGERRVIPILEEALKEAGWSYDTNVNSQGEHVAGLTHIACTIGPGGFVSLRIGITAANTLAWALGLPLAGVHLGDLWAARVSSLPNPGPSPSPDFYWLHSTRRTQLFVRGFGAFKTQFPEPILIDLEDATTLHGNYVGELIDEHREALRGCAPLQDVQPLEAVLPPFLKKLTYRNQQLFPWYGREA